MPFGFNAVHSWLAGRAHSSRKGQAKRPVSRSGDYVYKAGNMTFSMLLRTCIHNLFVAKPDDIIDGDEKSRSDDSSNRGFRLLKAGEVGRIARITVLLLGINGLSLVALSLLPAVSVIVVTATIPVFVALFNKKLGREQLDLRFWCGALLCLAGVFIVVDIFPAIIAGKFAAGNILGYLAVVGAAACAVIYRVNMETLTKDFEPSVLLTWAFGINALLVLIFLCPFMGAIPREAMPMALTIGLAAAIANTAMLLSIRAVGSTFISFIALLQKPLVIIAASIFLSEHLSLMQWLGVAILLIGLKLARPQRVQ